MDKQEILLHVGTILLCVIVIVRGQAYGIRSNQPSISHRSLSSPFHHYPGISPFHSNIGDASGERSSSFPHSNAAGFNHNPASSGFRAANPPFGPGGSGFNLGRPSFNSGGFGSGLSAFRPDPFFSGGSGFGTGGVSHRSSSTQSKNPAVSANNASKGPASSNSSSTGLDSTPVSSGPISTDANSTTSVPEDAVSSAETTDATNASSATNSTESGSASSSSKSSAKSRRSTSSSLPSKSSCFSPPHFRSRFFHRHSQEPSDPLGGFKIVCLYNIKSHYKSGFSPSVIDPCLCTHLNYEFAMLDPKTYEMMSGDPVVDIQENYYQEAIDLKKINPDLKVILALGGWEDSTKKYSEMAEDKDKRRNFVEKAVSFLKAHEFDGMDLAWEYPNCWQGAIGISPKDKGNFVRLLQDLRSEFEDNDLELSVSVGGIKREIEAAYDVPGISAAVHHINVMTYDMHGPWEPVTGHHTQFEEVPGDSDPFCNVKGAMQVWMDKGADKKKLILGLAYYGKTFTLSDASNFKLGAPAKGIGNPAPESKSGGFILYREICQALNNDTMIEEEDKNAGFYAHSDDQWACYDPPAMVVKKAKYVVENDLGGVMMKDMSGDDYKGICFSMAFPLTKMTRYEIIHSVRRMRLKKG